MIKQVIFLIAISSALANGQWRTIVFYGTSLTVTGKWVDNLMTAVMKDFPDVEYYNNAKGGMNSIWGIANLSLEVIHVSPDIVTIEFAINDCVNHPAQYYNDVMVPLDLSKQNAEEMIDLLRNSNPKIKIFILGMNFPLDSLIDGRNAASDRPEWRTYYQIWKTVANEKHVGFIDITEEWSKLNKDTLWSYIPDGIHPSEQGGLTITVPTILPVIENCLKELEGSDGIRGPDMPTSFDLKQNFPNPFNPSTSIVFDIPTLSHVTLTVYDILGRRVETLVDGEKSQGHYRVTFDGSKLNTGMYFYRLQAGAFSELRKLMLLK